MTFTPKMVIGTLCQGSIYVDSTPLFQVTPPVKIEAAKG